MESWPARWPWPRTSMRKPPRPRHWRCPPFRVSWPGRRRRRWWWCPIGSSMWWCRAAGAALLLLALAGCGFRPLYGTRAADPYVGPEMGGIYISPLPDRDGQLVRNALLDRIDPKGEPQQPRYRLDIKLTVTESQ